MSYKYAPELTQCPKCGTWYRKNAECPHTDPEYVAEKEEKSGER